MAPNKAMRKTSVETPQTSLPARVVSGKTIRQSRACTAWAAKNQSKIDALLFAAESPAVPAANDAANASAKRRLRPKKPTRAVAEAAEPVAGTLPPERVEAAEPVAETQTLPPERVEPVEPVAEALPPERVEPVEAVAAVASPSDLDEDDAAPAKKAKVDAASGRTLQQHFSDASASSAAVEDGGLQECKNEFDVHSWALPVASNISKMTTQTADGTTVSVLDSLEAASLETTWSGCFSGIETYASADARMAIAFRQLRRPHGRRRGRVPLQHARHVWCCEWNATARGELLIHPCLGDCCIFGDIISFVKPEFDAIIKHVQKFPHLHHVLKDVVISGRLVGRRPRAWCYRHGRYCVALPTDGHRAGTPRTDFSKQGHLQHNVFISI